jgi:hypothetical protein
MLVIGGATASAQTAILQPSTTITRTARLAPLATSSFAPTSFGGTFNGSPVTIALGWVSLTGPADPVLMGQYKDSGIRLETPQGIANGNYSVEFAIPWANAPATLSLVRGTTEIAQCAVQQQLSYAAGSLVQRCDSGPIPVSDGNLNLTIQIKDPNPTCPTCRSAQQLSVSRITINLWR